MATHRHHVVDLPQQKCPVAVLLIDVINAFEFENAEALVAPAAVLSLSMSSATYSGGEFADAASLIVFLRRFGKVHFSGLVVPAAAL